MRRSLFEDECGRDGRCRYIVIIIDELADLMMLDRATWKSRSRARADGARGRHSPGAGDAASVGRRDHRTDQGQLPGPHFVPRRDQDRLTHHFDANGAEALLGKGDMLYLPSGSARVHRLHAPFVTEKEIAAVVEFWKARTAEYQQQFLEAPKEERGEAAEVAIGAQARTTMIRCTRMRCDW